MKESEEYINAMLQVLEKISGRNSISMNEVMHDCTPYWATIFDELRDRGVAKNPGYEYAPILPSYIPAVKAEYQDALRRIKDAEEERRLRMKHMRADIRQIRQAKLVAWISLAIAAGGLTVSVLTATVWR